MHTSVLQTKCEKIKPKRLVNVKNNRVKERRKKNKLKTSNWSINFLNFVLIKRWELSPFVAEAAAVEAAAHTPSTFALFVNVARG